MSRLKPRSRRGWVIAFGVTAVALLGAGFGGALLTGAITLPGSNSAAEPVRSSAPTASATQTPLPPPVYEPAGDAAANQLYFDYVVTELLVASPDADGRAFVDALVAGGFSRDDMQVTFDRTHVDLAADSVQFSVQFTDQCLVGQNGAAAGGFSSAVLPILGSGTCLVGVTRQIDW
jgi:hypothetical protein